MLVDLGDGDADMSPAVGRLQRVLAGRRGCTGHLLMSTASAERREQAAEGATELGVEDRVDDRVEKAVDVAEPDAEREEDRLDLADRVPGARVVTDADGVDDVQREERSPADEEHACK